MTHKERSQAQVHDNAHNAAPTEEVVATSDSNSDEEEPSLKSRKETVSAQETYEKNMERKLRRRRRRRAKRQAGFNRFVRGGGGANSQALIEAQVEDGVDSASSSSDEDVYGRSKGEVSKYDKYDNYDLTFPGDYGYEGWFRAGRIWNGGVFIARHGKPVHHAHYRYFAHRLKNSSLPPELNVLSGLEQRVGEGRMRIQRNTVVDNVSRRLTRETENVRSYRYWRKIAKLNMAEYRTRNQQLQQGVRELRETLVGEKASEAWNKAAGGGSRPKEDFIQTKDDTIELYGKTPQLQDIEDQDSEGDEQLDGV
jgi:hypothetical protein